MFLRSFQGHICFCYKTNKIKETEDQCICDKRKSHMAFRLVRLKMILKVPVKVKFNLLFELDSHLYSLNTNPSLFMRYKVVDNFG